MNLNQKTLEIIKQNNGKLVAVTKYWDLEATQSIIQACQDYLGDLFLGIGENRTHQIQEKEAYTSCPLHFIGNVQSRQIKHLEKVRAVHSLSSLSHAALLNQLAADRGQDFEIFVQVKISQDPLKLGIEESALEAFLNGLSDLKHLELKGLSAMGAGEFSEGEKRKEFQSLIRIRDQYMPGLSISAGTSRDFEIALGEGIDIVRIGHNLIHA